MLQESYLEVSEGEVSDKSDKLSRPSSAAPASTTVLTLSETVGRGEEMMEGWKCSPQKFLMLEAVSSLQVTWQEWIPRLQNEFGKQAVFSGLLITVEYF